MAGYLITGATGYIGSMLVKYIKKVDREADITAQIRDKKKAEDILPSDIRIWPVDLLNRGLMEQTGTDLKYDYVIHCASITKSSEMIQRPVEVTESIVNTTQNVLEIAKRCQVKSFVYISSMEIYGRVEGKNGHRTTETELGDIDILQARSCYPLGKRMAENICYSYYREYGVPVKIARLAQTFGKGVPSSDNRVFAQFANAVKQGKDIVLHTEGNSVGNYCDIIDVMEGILTILHLGKNGEAYNVVNEENTMTIRQMAELVADRVAGGRIKVVYEIPEENKYGYASDTGLRMSGQKLAELGWIPRKTLYEMYCDIL